MVPGAPPVGKTRTVDSWGGTRWPREAKKAGARGRAWAREFDNGDGMNKSSNLRIGGHILADQLRIHGVELAFGVPGESYLALLDGLYDVPEVRYVTCRQEGGAAMMAEAYGKLTGKPGVCMVTRGPGATNASPGLHIGFQDSTPMVLLVGQVGRAMSEREAFQEIDYRRMFGQMAKWVGQIEQADRIPEMVSHAFHLATSGRPGPVVLALPEDMLCDPSPAADAGPAQRIQAHPGAAQMARLRALLAGAKRPLVLLGGGGWSAPAVADIRAFVEANELPAAVTFRCQDRIDNDHPNYAGHVGIGIDPRLARCVQEADLLMVVGARLGEMTTGGYGLIDIPRPKQTLVHVHPGAEELGRVYQAEMLIHAGMAEFAAAAKALAPVDARAWSGAAAEAHRHYLDYIQAEPIPGALQMGEVMATLNATLPPETIVTNGAGNYSAWPNRFYKYRSYPSQLAPTSGSMGYGVPAAVAAKLVHPERPVVAFAGDGCFLMNGQELATAVSLELNIVVLVVNNGMYGTIRMHQERDYPGRILGTGLVNPDFAALARAYGAEGETVTRTEDFAPAFARALAAEGPSVLDLRIDPEAITPTTTISQIREAAAKAQAD
jgi:acetolactate synthase-1/2/3 large subunit